MKEKELANYIARRKRIEKGQKQIVFELSDDPRYNYLEFRKISAELYQEYLKHKNSEEYSSNKYYKSDRQTFVPLTDDPTKNREPYMSEVIERAHHMLAELRKLKLHLPKDKWAEFTTCTADIEWVINWMVKEYTEIRERYESCHEYFLENEGLKAKEKE